ncbi:hypothetical protein FB451DRAFT_1414504 [Mycena latifolia]|nr:hypothetical protein FB451DRAFT_1414504 [Mycena latifolia]
MASLTVATPATSRNSLILGAPFGRKILDYSLLYKHVPAVFDAYSRAFSENDSGLYELQLSLMIDLEELLELERKWTEQDYSARALLLISERILQVTASNKVTARSEPSFRLTSTRSFLLIAMAHNSVHLYRTPVLAMLNDRKPTTKCNECRTKGYCCIPNRHGLCCKQCEIAAFDKCSFSSYNSWYFFVTEEDAAIKARLARVPDYALEAKLAGWMPLYPHVEAVMAAEAGANIRDTIQAYSEVLTRMDPNTVQGLYNFLHTQLDRHPLGQMLCEVIAYNADYAKLKTFSPQVLNARAQEEVAALEHYRIVIPSSLATRARLIAASTDGGVIQASMPTAILADSVAHFAVLTTPVASGIHVLTEGTGTSSGKSRSTQSLVDQSDTEILAGYANLHIGSASWLSEDQEADADDDEIPELLPADADDVPATYPA